MLDESKPEVRKADEPKDPSPSAKTPPTKVGVKPSAYGVMRADGSGGTEVMPGHLYFYIRNEHKGNPIPKDQEASRLEIEALSGVLRIVFFADHIATFDKHFTTLLVIAQGAFSPHGFVPEALNSLPNLKTEIVKTGGSLVKDSYFKRMMRACAIAAGIILTVSIALHFLTRHAIAEQWVTPDTSGFNVSTLNTGFLLAASMIGLIFASFLRNLEITYETLVTPDADLASPWVRVTVYGIAIWIMSLLFQLKVVTAAIGPVSTALIADSTIIAVVVGLLLGVAERAVPKEVIRWTGEFVKKFQPKSGS